MLHRLVSLVLIYFLFLQTTSIHAHPIGSRKNASKSTTLRTVHTTMTGDGPVTETCDITLTPITDNKGRPAVEEVRKCFLTFEDDDKENPGTTTVPSVSGTMTSQIPPAPVTSATGISSSTAVSSVTSTITSQAPAISVTSSSGSPSSTGNPKSIPVTSNTSTVPTATSTPTSSPQPTQSASSSTGNPAPVESPTTSAAPAISTGVVVVPGTSAITTPATSPTPSSAPDSGPSQPAESNTAATPTTGDSSGTTAAQSSGTSAADSTPSTTAGFQLPGKKLSVLPIGLGVFAGISVIALIVVGLVTYERTKYRKAFRQRKLAESGATMGYGGMAQRP